MRITLALGALALAGMLSACGTSSAPPDGSKFTTLNGVAITGYPHGHPKDAASPALGSSTEDKYSHEGPKVPVPVGTTGPRNQPGVSREGPGQNRPQ